MPSPNKLDTRLNIRINGVPLAAMEQLDVIELTVDSDYFLPTMFDFTMRDDFNTTNTALSYIDGEKFKIGSLVSIDLEVSVGEGNKTASAELVNGVITSLEPEFTSDSHSRLHVRGYDKGYKLMSGEKTVVYGDGRSRISESDIISKICGEAGLTPQVDSSLSSVNNTYVMQLAQTHWDFLWSRARRLGYQIYVSGNVLYVKKANQPRNGGIEVALEWGRNLGSFAPRLSIVGQMDTASVTSWDANTKQKVSGEKKDGSLSTNLNKVNGMTAQALSSNYVRTTLTYSEEPGLDQATAEKIADARLSVIESNLLQASGQLTYGDPRVTAGEKIKVEKVGSKYSGSYYVTHAHHVYSNGEYRVDFDVSGTAPHTLAGLVGSSAPAGGNSPLDGVVVGVVTRIDDPDKLGRVKVKFPWMPAGGGGAELESNWARIASIGAGKQRGLLFLPEVNDEVLVTFEHGDVDAPYIIGGLWNKKDTLPDGKDANLADQKLVNQRVIRSRSGHLILLDDKQGEEQILIQDKTKNNSILIDSKNNAMTFKSQKDFIFETDGNFSVKAKGDVTFESTGKFEIKNIKSLTATALQEIVLKASTSQLALKASGSELSGMMVDVKANTKVSVSGSAMAEIKGGLVKIN